MEKKGIHNWYYDNLLLDQRRYGVVVRSRHFFFPSTEQVGQLADGLLHGYVLGDKSPNDHYDGTLENCNNFPCWK